MKTSKPWRIEARADNNSLEIFLYDEIGDYGTGITAKAFTEDLRNAGPVDSINLHVNSPGGSVFDGISIYNSLLNSGAKVTATVDGLAASIASVIVMAASKIFMARNAMLMIHNPHMALSGESGDFKKMAETMDKVKGSIVMAYQRHSNLTPAEIGSMMNDETWMTAQEAVAHGFADEIIEDAQGLPIAAKADLSKFRNVPVQLIAARLTPKAAPVEEYIPQFSGRTLAEIDAEHQRLTLQHKLNQARYRQ
jgi:ATP-dependent Clp endopeptidase proteolytic subunit ClpP